MPAAGGGRARVADEAGGTAHNDIDGNEIVTHDRTRPKGHRDQEAEAVGFLRNEPQPPISRCSAATA